MARPTEHGEIWWASVDKPRPVVVLSRDDIQGVRDRTTVASITTTIRGIRTEVALDHRDGFATASAINCDELTTIAKSRLERRLGRLSPERLDQLQAALRFALQL